MSLSSIPDPWALCLVLALLPAIVIKVVPAVTRWVGRGITAGASPIPGAALVLPEFWLASALRRRSAHVPAAVHAYDRNRRSDLPRHARCGAVPSQGP